MASRQKTPPAMTCQTEIILAKRNGRGKKTRSPGERELEKKTGGGGRDASN